ncbi:MAG: hypothetical protein R3E01_22945 [Pirellulaceae bacterium]|nr:hypothetical protein [Planctomycetales bacterium]
MQRRMVILEANEIPPRVFQHYAKTRPNSAIASLLKQARLLTTEALDVPEETLYPSQSWASFNVGAPFDNHQIRWYNDPKPAAYPLYWQIIANHGHSVGIVGTLHSSPAKNYLTDNYVFVVPDCFANDGYTRPTQLEPFQAFNLKMTAGNGRVANAPIPRFDKRRLLFSLPSTGISPSTYMYCAKTVAGIAAKRVGRERLRVLQFPLTADIFLKQLKQKRPELAVLFTNHVAANMHRYWYALFPEDYNVQVYGPEWCQRFGREIMVAMELLDRYIGKLMRYCSQHQATFLITSSMGQGPNHKLPERVDLKIARSFRLDHVRTFVSAIVPDASTYTVEAAMVPQYTIRFANSDDAKYVRDQLQQAKQQADGINMGINLNDTALTISVELDHQKTEFRVGERKFNCRELGFTEFPIEDHHSGRHVPDGSLIIYGSSTTKAQSDRVNFLEYTPAVLQYFGITRSDYMVEPTFTI